MKTIKKICVLALIIVCCVSVTAIVSRLSNGFTEKPNFTNENNLFHTIQEYDFDPGNFSNGLDIKINDNGSITINGKYDETASDNYVIFIGNISIEKESKYTLSGAPNGTFDTYYLTASYEDLNGNIKTLYSDKSDTMTSEAELTKGMSVILKIEIVPGAELKNVTIKPTFVAGTEAGKF